MEPSSSSHTPHPLVPPPSYLPSMGTGGGYPFIYSEPEVSLVDYLRIVKKNWLKIFLITLICTSLAGVLAWKSPKKYQSTISLMTLSSSGGGGSGLASQLNNLPILGGQLSSLMGGSQKSGQIVNILKSRTMAEKLIQDFNLMNIFFGDQWDPIGKKWNPDWLGKTPVLEDGVKVWQKKIMTVIEDKKTGLIKIQVELKDPVLASQIANRLVVELQDFISGNQFTVAKRNRIFVDGQLKENRMELLELGKKLNQFYSTNQISNSQPQLDVGVGKIEPVAPSVEELRREFKQLDENKKQITETLSSFHQDGVVRAVPSQVYLQYLTLQRELLIKINGLLMQQYEMAKIEEAKEDLAFQVIDKAVPTVRPAKPQKMIYVGVGLLFGLFIGLFSAFLKESLVQSKKKLSLHD